MMVFYSIWQVRNSYRFDSKVPNLRRVCLHIKALLFDIGKFSGGTMANEVNDLLTLHFLGITRIPPKAPSISLVCWFPPLPGWVKLNTDGLSKGNPGLATTAGVFRSYRGFVQGIFTSWLGEQTAFYAELSAAIIGIEQAWIHG
ncbi:hypothetical protein L1049_010116 [Liquidambar formosana]|uniref:RNase H type-1 domain-containing protein n=1 Tax=Liquidambar formosana TaxID=63359 RepID=A0AAP0NAH8_LIQFO